MEALRKAGIVLGLVAAAPVLAGPYVELGVFTSFGNTCPLDNNGIYGVDCSDNPLGHVAAGYNFNGLSLEVSHLSSLVEKDHGLHLIGVKYRYEWK